MNTKYTIYKITNSTNSKIYIGKHQTKNLDDGYIGSGKNLHRAYEKHCKENFTKEILFVFDTEDEMNAKEAEIVTEEFCLREDTYNICKGGHGGFGYINSNPESFLTKERLEALRQNSSLGTKAWKHLYTNDVDFRSQHLEITKNARNFLRKKYPNGTFLGRNHSEESKAKMKQSKLNHGSGQNNSQFGTMWITNGSSNRKIKSVDIIPEGWYKGRVK